MTIQQHDMKPKWWQTLIKGDYLNKRPRRGDICEATILSIGEHDILVELAGKRDGLIQREDLAGVDDAYLAKLEVGDLIPVRIMRVPYDRSAILVSLKQGLKQQEWMRVKGLQESQEIIEVEVLEVNRGGLIATLGELHGFVPNSHLVAVPRGMRGKKQQTEKMALIGKSLHVVVLEVQPNRRRLVLSERVAQRQRRETLLDELYEGAIRSGIVRNLTNYGAFVDLGGVDGLLHISQLSWDFVEHPRDVLDVGDEVEVYVLDVDRERERISLSRKHLLPPEWVGNVQAKLTE
ncbi:MAG: S1 RNA-binding domain-containing protein [Anaerolineae bacterium]|nr:S1 RNA-binding domain-containing protein [Anaerolineae bacterium]